MDTTIITAVVIAGLSFILQKTLSNIIYGLIMLLTRPFKKGDKITVIDRSREIASGKVFKITPLHVHIKAYNRDVSIIPNSLLETCVIKNSDYKEGVNHTECIMLTLDSNLKKAKKIVLEELVQHPKTFNSKDNTHIIVKVDSGAILMEYNVRTSDVNASFDVSSEICESLITKFAKHSDIIFSSTAKPVRKDV